MPADSYTQQSIGLTTEKHRITLSNLKIHTAIITINERDIFRGETEKSSFHQAFDSLRVHTVDRLIDRLIDGLSKCLTSHSTQQIISGTLEC